MIFSPSRPEGPMPPPADPETVSRLGCMTNEELDDEEPP